MSKTFKKIILDDLKAQGLERIAKKIKSIRYSTFSMGDAVDVETVNLFKTDRKILSNFLKDYQDGNFDGMTDCYEYKPSAERTKERTAKYVHTQNEFTEDVKERVVASLKALGITDDESANRIRCFDYDVLIHRERCKLEE